MRISTGEEYVKRGIQQIHGRFSSLLIKVTKRTQKSVTQKPYNHKKHYSKVFHASKAYSVPFLTPS